MMQLKVLVSQNPFQPPKLPERMVWTSSSIKLFRRCKRKWFWKYVLRLRPRYRDKNLLVGSAFHDLLAEWYKGQRTSMAKIVGRYTGRLESEYETSAGFYDSEDLDKLRCAIDAFTGMMLAYEEVYKRDRRDWKIVRPSIEAKFQVDMGDFDYAGKIDLVANNFLVEHKTTSKISETYIDRLPLDTQIRGYIYGALNGLHLRFNSVLYDVVLKSKLRRKSNESLKDFSDRVAHAYTSEPGKYFYREELRFDRADLDAFRFEVQQAHLELQDLVGRGLTALNGQLQREFFTLDPRAWMPNDHACTDWFRTCEFHKLCTIGLDQGTALGYDQGDTMNQELDDDEA